MSNVTAVSKQSAIQVMASRLNVDPDEMQGLVMNTLMKAKGGQGQVSNEEFVTFLAIANEYRLNPLTKEIYAFNNRGAIQPIVSVDGWLKIINGNPQFDGMEYVDNVVDGQLMSITCRIYRKDRQRPTEVTEYMDECRQGTQTWNKWPARMLRHKATIQAARYAFGLSGIIDEDEAERYKSVHLEREVNPSPASKSGGVNALKAVMDGKPEKESSAAWSQEQDDKYQDIIDRLTLSESQEQLSALANEIASLGELPGEYRAQATALYKARKVELEVATE